MIGLASIGVALLQSLGDALSNGTYPDSVRVLPCKTIVFSGGTDDPLCVLIYFSIVMLFQSVFVLRLDVAAANLDGIQFIGTDASENDLLATRFGVESPFPFVLDERDRQWPILITDG